MGGRNTAGRNTKKVGSGENPSYFLCSDEESVNQVRVENKGSRTCKVEAYVQGVPALGVVDRGVDITIMGEEVFKQVAAVTHLEKKGVLKARQDTLQP